MYQHAALHIELISHIAPPRNDSEVKSSGASPLPPGKCQTSWYSGLIENFRAASTPLPLNLRVFMLLTAPRFQLRKPHPSRKHSIWWDTYPQPWPSV